MNTCKTCKSFQLKDNTCHRYAPGVLYTEQKPQPFLKHMANFPKIDDVETNVCDEYEPKEEQEDKPADQ